VLTSLAIFAFWYDLIIFTSFDPATSFVTIQKSGAELYSLNFAGFARSVYPSKQPSWDLLWNSLLLQADYRCLVLLIVLAPCFLLSFARRHHTSTRQTTKSTRENKRTGWLVVQASWKDHVVRGQQNRKWKTYYFQRNVCSTQCFRHVLESGTRENLLKQRMSSHTFAVMHMFSSHCAMR
jgi:hypothetical protein